jgi:four helix bundle protein
MSKQKPFYQQQTDEMMIKLGFDPKTGGPASQKRLKQLRKKLGDSKRRLGENKRPPFRIRALEKTKRQSPRGLAYQHSAVYRNAVILRLLGKKFTNSLDPVKDKRLIEQIDSELRSVVANIREGYLRPTSAEFSTFLGFSQGSLEEFRGDIIDTKDDGLLKSKPGNSLASLKISLKPPPNISPRKHLRELKRRIRDVKSDQLTYEIFLELVNKTDYLLKRAVDGIDKKIISDEEKKLNNAINNEMRKYW